MHTIGMLRRTLGLSSDNQVRNRIERIKDLLSEHIRRGPNNQLFLTDPGLDLMKQFQDLYDTGLTLTEASNVIRATSYQFNVSPLSVSSRSALNEMKPDRSTVDLATGLRQELTQIRAHLSAIETQLQPGSSCAEPAIDSQPWWTHLREDIDVT
ncbi:hypothetical protein IH601_11810 [Candidatus Bipolaricaulota bacterium]|jgi:hypothetical protein|nr:hypothetical protein [Candidatus Bipolaricaulota bacterium]TFH08167.1 MAG: hypothetical protein E4H08_08260 [Candidatus Atribacteria bacterium]